MTSSHHNRQRSALDYSTVTEVARAIGLDPTVELKALLGHPRRVHRKYLSLARRALSEIPDEIYDCVDLQGIDLSNNELRTLPTRLLDMAGLRRIDVCGNPIEILPDHPGLVIDAQTYARCRRSSAMLQYEVRVGHDALVSDVALLIADLCEALGPRRLVLGNRDDSQPARPSAALEDLLDSLPRFRFLESLSFHGLALNSVPEGIRELRQLSRLRLDLLGLTALPDWLAELPLAEFTATNNAISALPEALGKMSNLRYFDLSWNPLRQIPEVIFELTGLENLSLFRCLIDEVPRELLRLKKLKRLEISTDYLLTPPAEVARKGLGAIRGYWRQRAATGVDYLCEAKLIILGEPGAGKTSLARKICDKRYQLSDSEQSTEGIDVMRYEFPTTLRLKENAREKSVRRKFEVNIWDFGGQEIYHATHQFFLTRRSVYVLVCDDRKEDTDFLYWLNIVNLLSGASPLIIVHNEKQDRTRDINLGNLRSRFANLRASLHTNLQTNRGLEELILVIRKELECLPHVGVGLPVTWKRVREALENDKRDYISIADYLDICQMHGFTEHRDKLQLSEYLHDLGSCLHFQQDSILKHTVILKPSWGTDAVYRVLDHPDVIASHGRFTRSQLGKIWAEAKYQGMQDELLQLMIKFQLCYALGSGEAYIAPQLLSAGQPDYTLDDHGDIVLRYEYGFLPKGIITRFIVAQHRLISGERVWKSGVVLERPGSFAEVIEEYGRNRINIRVGGPNRLGLLAIIDEQFAQLHESFHGLQVECFRKCACTECVRNADHFSFSLSALEKMGKKGKPIQCHHSGEMVDAATLVDTVFPGRLNLPNRSLATDVVLLEETAPQPAREVFVSYAWGGESDAMVDRLHNALAGQSIELIRDREAIGYRESIRAFMQRIGRGKCIILVISDQYLRSANCMFELVEIDKAKDLRNRIFPIVLSDAAIYDASSRLDYIKYWEEKTRILDQKIKQVQGSNISSLQQELNRYMEIRRLFDGILSNVSDMNALTPECHHASGFDALVSRLRAQLDS